MAEVLLSISKELAERIRAHGAETYPHECCGALLGRDDEAREILGLFPLINRRDDSPQNRFSVTAQDVLDAEKFARQQELDVVGWYHSHPDHPAKWSTTDLAEAHWLGCSYVITSVEKGKAALTNSFQLDGTDEDDKKLVDEVVDLV